MNQLTILTIDDEENIRNGLADNFELEGYNVLQASNGKEGLAIIAKGGVDLVITDLRMDGISGEEVVQHVTTENPGIPIIVLTGHGSIEEANKAIKAGAYYFLTKPLNLDHLNKIVKNACDSFFYFGERILIYAGFKSIKKIKRRCSQIRKRAETSC